MPRSTDLKNTDAFELAMSKKFYSTFSSEDMEDHEKRTYLETGITTLDRKFPFPTGYYVICANPGSGKGWFALWLSRKAYEKSHIRTAYFSLEMDEPLVRDRIKQQWSDLSQQQYQQGISTAKAQVLMREDAIVVDLFHSDDTKFQTPEDFEKQIAFYHKIGFRLFHFDHLHELDGANTGDTNQRVTDTWAKCFQQICKAYPDIWLFVYAQPNGAAANKQVITRTDIAGSKAITQKCEFFLSLNRKLTKGEDGQMIIDEENREVILWLDKSRITAASHIGFRLYFSETGNYTDQPDDLEGRVKASLL